MAARIAGHPVHPMLIVFPIGLWVFSLVADILFLWGGRNPFWRDAAYYTMFGGFVGALAAAVPGLLDYRAIRDSGARRTGKMHMVLNLAVVGLYALNIWMRGGNASIAGLPFVLSLVGVILLSFSGWLGGELVYVDRIGVADAAPPRAERDARPHIEDAYVPPPHRASVHGKSDESIKSAKEGRL